MIRDLIRILNARLEGGFYKTYQYTGETTVLLPFEQFANTNPIKIAGDVKINDNGVCYVHNDFDNNKYVVNHCLDRVYFNPVNYLSKNNINAAKQRMQNILNILSVHKADILHLLPQIIAEESENFNSQCLEDGSKNTLTNSTPFVNCSKNGETVYVSNMLTAILNLTPTERRVNVALIKKKHDDSAIQIVMYKCENGQFEIGEDNLIQSPKLKKLIAMAHERYKESRRTNATPFYYAAIMTTNLTEIGSYAAVVGEIYTLDYWEQEYIDTPNSILTQVSNAALRAPRRVVRFS